MVPRAWMLRHALCAAALQPSAEPAMTGADPVESLSPFTITFRLEGYAFQK